jgi:hypothetical protein
MTDLNVRNARGHHPPGETVEILVTSVDPGTVTATISRLGVSVATLTENSDGGTIRLRWHPPAEAPVGYGVDVTLSDGIETIATGRTAFDVLDHWTQYPRYGFLSDFAPDKDTTMATEALVSYQVNAVQFYDWQYRHDQLLAPTEIFLDPLGRELSLSSIRDSIRELTDVGIASMAYMAIYAASAGFWSEHPDWAMYDPATDQPIEFGENFLGLMDPTRRRPWSTHLQDQCRRALEFGFDGIHVDQYGEPREANTITGEPIDLPGAFAHFVDDLKSLDVPVTMNAVKNWPIKSLAPSHQDFTYIELWPDTPTYREIAEIVLNARALAPKAVVIAMYLPAHHPANISTLDALLTAAGAWRIEIGENGRLLTDPYFPEHQAVPPELAGHIRRHAEFAVQYLELCGPPAHLDPGIEVDAPEGVTAITRSSAGLTAISLVNLPDPDTRWDEAHPAPPPRTNLTIRVEARIDRAWFARPEDPTARSLKMVADQSHTTFEIPRLDYFGVVWFERREDVNE